MAMRKFNTKAMKLSTTQVQQLYDRLLQGETQGSLAREYRISVVQVGRIARGESRANETGANTQPVPNFNLETRPVDVEASMARLRSILDEPPAALTRIQDEIRLEHEKAQAVDSELDKLEKGDST